VLGLAVRDLQEAVAELRRLAAGVRPRGLDEGLTSAIRSLVRACPFPVDLRISSEKVPDEVATTAYYVAAEAMTNALKHSGTTSLDISVSRVNGGLQVLVTDRGRGGARVLPGSGLAGLRDRVLATGGRLEVRSVPGEGTEIEARLPCE
jgi:signal transduction histidine kinase